jgi:hypothetical protein
VLSDLGDQPIEWILDDTRTTTIAQGKCRCGLPSTSIEKKTADGSPRYRSIPASWHTGPTRDDAIDKAKASSLRVLADRIEHGEPVPEMDELVSVTS